MSMGTKTKRAFRSSLTVPLTSNMNNVAEFSAYGLEKDLTSYASCFEGVKGLKAGWKVRNSLSFAFR